jgi:hypothetical protein
MIERRDRTRLLLETPQAVGIARKEFGEDLQRDLTA